MSYDQDDPFALDNILDNSSPIGDLPDIENVPEFVDLENDQQANFSFLETDIPMGAVEPQPEQLQRQPFPVQVIDHVNNSVIVDANSGGVLDIQPGSDLPEDLGMLNADGSVREPEMEDTLPMATPPCVNHEEHAHEEANAHIHLVHADYGGPNVHPNQVETVEDDMPLATQTPNRRRKRDREAESTTVNVPVHPHSAAYQGPMLHPTNVHPSNVTTPTAVTPIAATTANARIHHPAPQVVTTMQTIEQACDQARVNANVTPSQANVTNVAPQRTAPQVPRNHPSNLYLDAQSPTAQVTAQQNGVNMSAHLIPPTSPLGSLPGGMRDMLLVHARRQSYAGAEIRALQMAQNAAVKIHTMAQNGELGNQQPNPNTTQASVPAQDSQSTGTPRAPKVRRTRSKTSTRGSSRNPPRQTPSASPSAHMAVAQPQAQAIGTQNFPASSVPGTPVLSNVTRTPSQEVPLSRVSSDDFQSNHMSVPQHPLTPIPLAQLQGTLLPSTHVPADSANVVPQHPMTASHPHPVAPAPTTPPVTPVHPKRPITAHPKHPATPVAPKHPMAPVQNHYPQHMMPAPTQLVQGAGPSSVQVTEREATAAEVAVHAISATFNEMAMMEAAAATPTATWEQLAAAGLVAPPAAPEYPHPQASVPPISPAAQRQASQRGNGPRLRFSKNAGASKYCHICGRSSNTVAVSNCANLPIGLCRKVLCEKCLIIHEPETAEWAKQKGAGWMCTHCRNRCPPRARCKQYTLNNQKRREKNNEKKRLKKLKQQQEQEERENKRRRRNDRHDDPGDSPTGISDNVF